MNHTTQTHEPSPLTREERFKKQGFPILAIGASALFVFGLAIQTFVNEQNHNASVAAAHKADKLIDDFNKQLDSLAIQNASPENVIDGSEFTIPDNTVFLGEKALQIAGATGSDPANIEESAYAISHANLIQPGSEFVLSTVAVQGTDEVIVQRAPAHTANK
jgi:hypothetical protein